MSLGTSFEFSALSALKGFLFFFFLDCYYASLFLFLIQFSCLLFSAFGEPCVLPYLFNMGVFSSLSSSFCLVSCHCLHFFFIFFLLYQISIQSFSSALVSFRFWFMFLNCFFFFLPGSPFGFLPAFSDSNV